MRRVVSAVFAAALMLPHAPAPAVSQDMEQGDLGMVMTVEVAPADRAAYRSAVEKLNEAAKAAGIDGYEWHFWSSDKGFLLYYPIPNFAYFDDPMQLWRQFDGTPGEDLRNEFFAGMQSIPQSTKTEVVETIPSLTYWPEGYSDVGASHVHFEWLATGGSEDAWMENARGWIALMKKVGYPYGVRAYRTRIGDERMIWVFFVPRTADFYADEAWDDLIEAAGAGDDVKALNDAWEPLVSHWEHSDMSAVESMSYDPEDM